MAKKTTSQRISGTASRVVPSDAEKPLKRLETKFKEEAFLPNTILRGIAHKDRILTSDGIVASIRFIGVWDNSTQWYDEELNDQSIRLYGMSFTMLKNIWESRIRTDGVWHLVKMERIET